MTALRRLANTMATLALIVGAAGGLGLAANNPPTFDPRDDGNVQGLPGLGAEKAPPGMPAADVPAVANPLWGIPLTSLTATRDRPLFTPSRRPPAPVVPPTAIVEPPKTVAVPVESEKPPLSLVGIVAGTADGFAVFISNSTRDIVRLKTGEGHEGWILRSVQGREAVLEKNRRTAVLGLPPPTGDQK
jgi:general secretion pathway protein N